MAAKVRIYQCTTCGKDTDRDLLMVKKVVFLGMGPGGRTHKSRVKGWVCPDCVAVDPDWSLDAFVAPGNKFVELSPADAQAIGGELVAHGDT